MRALVTGGNGFVGGHLVAALRARGDEPVTAGHPGIGGPVDIALDLGDAASVAAAVAAAEPEVVYHLAAQAFVPRATEAPLETYDVNVLGTARLIDAVRALPAARRPRIVFASSSEVYGVHPPAAMPLAETAELRPATPYAASKVAGEAVVLASARTYGISAIVTRAFNHIGPGQSERFAVARFAHRLAAIAAGGPALFPVGDLSTARDFLDVRDVVAAYVALAREGSDGEVYNVCSGTPVRMQDVLRSLVTIARVGVEIREDPALMRPSDIPTIAGDAAKLRAATGWAPAYPLARSLRDIYEAAVAAVAAGA